MPLSWTEEEFLHFRPNFTGFTRVAAYRPNDVTLELPGRPMKLMPGLSVSAEFFDVLGASPLLGRTFQAAEDTVGPPPSVVLSHSLGALQKQLEALEQDKRATVRSNTVRILGLGLGFASLDPGAATANPAASTASLIAAAWWTGSGIIPISRATTSSE